MRGNRVVAAGWALIPLLAGCSPLFGTLSPPASPVETYTPPLPALGTPAAIQTEPQTPEPFALDLTPLPTSTALPTLVLPSPPPGQGPQVWDGHPTYPGESRPDFYFRVHYDAASWALTTNQFGNPALLSRGIPGCAIAPTVGRGLPQNASVDHEVRQIGAVTYEVSTASIGGVPQFVSYAGGNGAIFTAFEVSFAAEPEACRLAAEGVLGTLGSVPLVEATAPAAP